MQGHRYIPRLADALLQDVVADHPACLIVGPRATGKTTSARRLAQSVVDLSEPRQAEAFRQDPDAVLRGLRPPVLIDEWQMVPESLGAVKRAVDHSPTPGQFLVTGSVRGDVDSPTWPGTGRLIQVLMYGMTERERERRLAHAGWLHRLLRGEEPNLVRSDVDLRGYVERALRSGFPEPALSPSAVGRSRWLSSYVDQLVTRDAEAIQGGRDPVRLRRYLEALALNSAGTVDDVTLSSSAGINRGTARAYDALLQNLLVAERVAAWTSNRLKRLALAPKRYLVDSGLFVGVLGLGVDDVLRDGDLLGRVIETFVVAQIRSELALMTPTPRMYHLRTAEGRRETDVIIDVGARRLVAIEIKATAAPRPDDARHLRWLRHELGDVVVATVLLHTGPVGFMLDDRTIAAPIASLWS